MIDKTFSSLGLDFKLSVPETTEEFDTLAKRAGACLSEAINNIAYRSNLAQFRDLFLHGQEADAETGAAAITGVEQETGIKRRTKEVARGDKTVEVYDESEAKYFGRVCATLGKKPEDFAHIARAVEATLVFDPSATERQPKAPSKPGKVFMTAAQSIIEAGKAEVFGEKYNCTDLSQEGIARRLKEIDDAKRAAAQADLVAGL